MDNYMVKIKNSRENDGGDIDLELANCEANVPTKSLQTVTEKVKQFERWLSGLDDNSFENANMFKSEAHLYGDRNISSGRVESAQISGRRKGKVTGEQLELTQISCCGWTSSI